MLASINPLGERARNQRYWLTIAAYIAGSTVAGAALGALLGIVGSPLAVPTVALLAVAAVALIGLAFDTRRFGLRVPGPRRQVNEDWLARYRGWVYGSGFGIQLGLAFLTIITASATWVAFACALFAGSAAAGAIIGATFGLARALPILSAARVRDPETLRSLVRRLDRLRPRVTVTTNVVQVASGVGLVALAIGESRVRQLAAYGVAVTVQTGWECRILRRAAALTSEQTHTVVHLANFPLPDQRDDFGSDLTHSMRADDIFVVLFEYGPDAYGKRLFAAQGLPQLTPEMFSPRGLQRPLPGQVGCQRFFTTNSRQFCLYVVAGGRTALTQMTAQVNLGLAGLEIEP